MLFLCFRLQKKNLSWGYDRCYCLFALMGGGALLAPLLLSALTSGSPVTTLAVTSPAAANPSAHFRLWNLSAVLSLAGTLLLFDLLGEVTKACCFARILSGNAQPDESLLYICFFPT